MVKVAAKDEYVRALILDEEEKSEKIANYWRIGMSLLFFIVSKGVAPEVPPFSQKVLWLGSTIYFLFSIYMLFHLRAGKYQPWLKYLSVFVDITLISFVMWAFGTFRTFKTEAFLLYYVWIALATMRLSVQLTIFSGILSLVCYTTLVVVALVMGTIEPGTITESFTTPKVSLQNQVLRIMYMSIVIFALTYGARAYRKLASRSYEYEMDAERQRMKAQRLESVGFLAGGIAHDFNNALAIITNNIHIAKAYSSGEDKTMDKLLAAEKAALKATKLTHQLLTFSKGGAPSKCTMDIGDIVSEAVSLSTTGVGVKYKVKEIPVDLPLVNVDEGQICQVLNNLLINAAQASDHSGTVIIMAENHTIKDGSNIPLPLGQYALISVTDKGQGIPEDNIARVFDPYFTTKKEGSGLGLATSYSIIKGHGGLIDVESTETKGATFKVYLPASDEMIQRPAADSSMIPQRNLNILIMDDEVEFLKSSGEALTMGGHTVTCVMDGAEAIDLYMKFKESDAPFDVVIMDLTIPGGMGGAKAIKLIKEMDPEVRAIVASGYSNDPVLGDHESYGFKGLLKKPFSNQQLNAELYRVTS